MAPTEDRFDRIARLKRKFLSLSKAGRIKQYVRYDRAVQGELPIPEGMPMEYFHDCREALADLLYEDFDGDVLRIPRFLEIARRRQSEPFVKLEG